mgnify:CR=1 FL=1
MSKIRSILLFSLFPLLMVACQSTPSNFHTKSNTNLYAQLGEKQGISEFVEDMINNLLVDKRTKPHFEEVNLDNLFDQLVAQFCELAGGPCQYGGSSMEEVHRDIPISDGQFNGLVEALMQAMDDNNIPAGAQNQLLALLAPMHVDIVSP